MAAKHYLVKAGLKLAVLMAENETDAKAAAKAAIVGDTNTDWDTAVVTDIDAVTAGADMEGWRLRVKVDTAGDVEVYNVLVTAGAADTLDDMANDAVTALETAGGALLTPSYATPNLTIAEIADNIGDHKVYVTVMPPATWPDPDIAIPGFVGAIVDEGIAGAVLTAALVPAQSIPVITSAMLAPAVADVRDGTDYGTDGDGSTGTCAVPAVTDVRFGVDVDAATGTCTVPIAANVRTGIDVDVAPGVGTCAVPTDAEVLIGVAVDAGVGTVTQAAEADVRTGTTYGPSLGLTGTCAVPTDAEVLIGVAVDAGVGTVTQAGVADVRTGTTFGPSLGLTGTCAVPLPAQVLDGVDVDATTGDVVLPAATDVESGVTFGSQDELTGTFAVPAETDVRDGTQFGAGGVEFTGSLDVQNKVFKLVVPSSVLIPRANGIDTLIVSAGSEADAKAMAKALSNGDIDAFWTNATAAELVNGTDMEDWTMNVTVTSAAGTELYDVTVTGGEGETLADMADAMATALEAAGGASLTPGWNAGTATLTVAAIADGIGDATLEVSVYPPLATQIAVPGFVSTIVDEGVAAAVLTVVMVTDNPIPHINVQAKNKE